MLASLLFVLHHLVWVLVILGMFGTLWMKRAPWHKTFTCSAGVVEKQLPRKGGEKLWYTPDTLRDTTYWASAAGNWAKLFFSFSLPWLFLLPPFLVTGVTTSPQSSQQQPCLRHVTNWRFNVCLAYGQDVYSPFSAHFVNVEPIFLFHHLCSSLSGGFKRLNIAVG